MSASVPSVARTVRAHPVLNFPYFLLNAIAIAIAPQITSAAPSPTVTSLVMQAHVIVVGAGVAGGALINVLARDGRRVLCIERELYDEDETFVEPSRIVGELLQPGGYAKLCQLGLRDALEGIDAQPIWGYGVFLKGRAERLPYGNEDDVCGRSFHNGRFLKRLREIAVKHPNVTLVEGNVVALDKDEDGKVVGVTFVDKEKNTQHARADLTIACDGCGSSLRKRAAADHHVRVYSKFHGLVLNMTDIPFPNHGHVVLADPSPVLFYPISSTEVRCLVDIPSNYQGSATDYMLQTVAPQIPPQFRAAFDTAVKNGGSRMMPNRVMPAAADMVPGAVLLGDSFNMRHPLTGGGMTVALSDVYILRGLLQDIQDLSDTQAVNTKLQMFYELRKPMSTTINILANALYTLFCARDPALREMRSACLDYLSSGGRMTQDPIGMLGGLKPSRYLLVAHFFAVALYGCAQVMWPFPTPSRVGKAWSIFKASFNIMKPLIDAERLSPLSWLPITKL